MYNYNIMCNKSYKELTYIVTGCTGFVGNVLTKKLINDGCNVIGFARSEKKVKKIFGDSLSNVVYGDVSNFDDVKKLFENANENYVVIHTVAKVSIGESSFEELLNVTVEGTKNIVSQCVAKKVGKLIHVSSTEAIPHQTVIEKDFKYVPEPEKLKKGYALAKSLADNVVFDAVKNDNLDASLIMLACVLGPGDYAVGHMSQMFVDYIEGKLPASIKAGYNCFDIRDVADVLDRIVLNSVKGESYIFAREPNSINDILKVISSKLDKKMLITLPIWIAYVGLPFLSAWSKVTRKRPLYTRAALSSLSARCDFPLDKTIKAFGYKTRPLEQTVGEHVDFLIENGLVKL